MISNCGRGEPAATSNMKVYYEYDDGTFWAAFTKGTCCYTVSESRYYGLYPSLLLKAGTAE
jgi:hypothetical protein